MCQLSMNTPCIRIDLLCTCLQRIYHSFLKNCHWAWSMEKSMLYIHGQLFLRHMSVRDNTLHCKLDNQYIIAGIRLP